MIKGIFEPHINVNNLSCLRNFMNSCSAFFRSLRTLSVNPNFIGLANLGRPCSASVRIIRLRCQRQHVAFRIELEDMLQARRYLEGLGIRSENFRGEDTGELLVFPFMPAVSIYFDDPDGHSVELIAMLPDAPRPELEILYWREWERLHGRELPAPMEE